MSSMSTLACENIHFAYPGGRKVLEGISLAVSEGEYVAVVGDNGVGKTTLSLVCAGALSADSGAVHIDGRLFPFDPQTETEFRRRIGYVFQNPEDGFVATDVYREAAFSGENFGVPPKILRRRVRELLERFNLWHCAHRSPLELSGGQKARLAIVSALVSNAKFLILDEPESFLDWRGQIALRETLAQIHRDVGIIHITQSAENALLANRIFDLNGKKFVSPKDFTENRREQFRLLPEIPIPSKSRETAVEVKNLEFAYDGEQILVDINLKISRGEIVGIVGASGAGKSTLALLIAGFLKPQSGEIRTDGRVGMLFQFPERQLFAETVIDDVAFGPKNLGFAQPEQIAREKLKNVGLPESLWEISPFALSDGQQRRAGIAGVLATEPDIVIFDEPFASLDFAGTADLFRIIADLSRRGATIILITHRTDLLIKLAPRTIALAGGKIAYDGPTEKLLSDTALCEKVGVKPFSRYPI